MSDVSIKPYEEADHDTLAQLWATVFPNDPPRNAPEVVIRKKLRVQPELMLLAWEGEELVGAVMAGDDGTRGWIHHLAVLPTHRHRGIGRALMEEAEAGLRRMGCPKVNLQIRATNTDVITFYEGLGYKAEELVSMGKLLELELEPPTE